MAKGRKPSPDSYICNLNDITFAIACRQQPNQGTEIEIVVPVKHSVTYEQMDNMIFLLNGQIYQTVPPNIYKEAEPLKHHEMRRNFYIYDSFTGQNKREDGNWLSDAIEVRAPESDTPVFLSYFWRSMEEKNSAFRR